MIRNLLQGPYHGRVLELSPGVTETLAFNGGRYVSRFRWNAKLMREEITEAMVWVPLDNQSQSATVGSEPNKTEKPL
jgi:hypothetical protein